MVDLEKHYNFKDIEPKWQDFWKKNKTYSWGPEKDQDNNFVVDTPPPTVSGHLHMGHIFSYTQTDFVVRYMRMIGKNVFYPVGFDDNGLPTERLVEKKKKIKASKMDRDEFISICKEVVASEEEDFRNLFKHIALSVDWEHEYQTISDQSRTISQMSFLDLIEKGQIYRDDQPILWDPIDQTSLAQADVEEKEAPSIMNEIIFKTEDGEELKIATTRPELLPACVCVFYHPEDKRYQKLKGAFAISPLFNCKVPILEDDSVLMEKGTGLVMCCTFGDMTDVYWWKKHKLALKKLVNKYGKIDEFSFGDDCLDSGSANAILDEIKGKKAKEAREIIINILKEKNLLTKQDEIMHNVKCAERSGGVLEIITAPGWFVKTVEHKEDLLKRSDEINWYPKFMKERLDNWIKSLSWDWCISRQRFFGVPFPVWYSKRAGEEGKPIFASPEQLPIDPLRDLPKNYSKDEVEPDLDVMDTWATSSVSPQLSSLGISEKFSIDKEKYQKLFPTDLRPQAHEIIRTWAFYTILKSHLHENKLPWKNMMISGWCLAEDKSKMSKSKGNIVDPKGLLEKYGSDVVRYWASTSRLGADTAFSEDIIKDGKRLVNKLWNASKFASMNFDKVSDFGSSIEENIDSKRIFCVSDKWILGKLQNVVNEATESFQKFEYAIATEKIEEFFWKDFCDNYLEIVKVRSYNEDGKNDDGQVSAVLTLYWILNVLLRLFAPILPHVTEELFSKIFDSKDSVHSQNMWPKKLTGDFQESVNQGDNIVAVLDMVRKFKAEKNLSIKAPLSKLSIDSSQKISEDIMNDLLNVTATDLSLEPSEESEEITSGDLKITIALG